MTIRLLMIVLALSACTKQKSVQTTPMPDNSSNTPAQTQKETPQPISSKNTVAAQTSVPVALDKETLAPYTRSQDNLRYRFSYASVEKTDAILFENGKASLTIGNLPVGKTSDLVFEIIENNVTRLRGTVKDLTLKASGNHVPLSLKPVADDNSQNQNSDTSNTSHQNSDTENQSSDQQQTSDTDTSQHTDPSAQTVKLLLEQHCAECHHQGGTEPALTSMSFPSENKATAQRILQQVNAGTMPPAPRDPLSAEEIQKLKSWMETL